MLQSSTLDNVTVRLQPLRFPFQVRDPNMNSTHRAPACFISAIPLQTRRTPLSLCLCRSTIWTPKRLCSQRPTTASSNIVRSVLSPQTETDTTEKSPRKTFARGETFSRRRIGLYELTREGVDPSVLLKRTYRFELIYGSILLSFVSIFFIIPVVTNTPLREDIISIIIAGLMAAYAVDTLSLQGLFQSTIITYFQDNKRVIRHESAHLLGMLSRILSESSSSPACQLF